MGWVTVAARPQSRPMACTGAHNGSEQRAVVDNELRPHGFGLGTHWALPRQPLPQGFGVRCSFGVALSCVCVVPPVAWTAWYRQRSHYTVRGPWGRSKSCPLAAPEAFFLGSMLGAITLCLLSSIWLRPLPAGAHQGATVAKCPWSSGSPARTHLYWPHQVATIACSRS